MTESTHVGSLFIAPGGPWGNVYIETFNGKLQEELLQGELFTSLVEARWLIERRRRAYNEERPHSSLGYQTPARFAAGCAVASDPTALTRADLFMGLEKRKTQTKTKLSYEVDRRAGADQAF